MPDIKHKYVKANNTFVMEMDDFMKREFELYPHTLQIDASHGTTNLKLQYMDCHILNSWEEHFPIGKYFLKVWLNCSRVVSNIGT